MDDDHDRAETDTDVELRVRFPPGTAAKNIQLALTKTKITLGLKGREGVILQVGIECLISCDFLPLGVDKKI